MPSFFRPNPHAEQELEREPEYTRGLAGKTEAAAAAARSFAPVLSGAYRDSIRVVKSGGKVYLSAFDFKAGWIEYGTVDTPTFSPLRRGIHAAGLKFQARPK